MFGRQQQLTKRQYHLFSKVQKGYERRVSIHSNYWSSLNKVFMQLNLDKNYRKALHKGFVIEEKNPFAEMTEQPPPDPNNPTVPDKSRKEGEEEAAYQDRLIRIEMELIEKRQDDLNYELTENQSRRKEIRQELKELENKFQGYIKDWEAIPAAKGPSTPEMPPEQSTPGSRTLSRERGSFSTSRSRSSSRSRSRSPIRSRASPLLPASPGLVYSPEFLPSVSDWPGNLEEERELEQFPSRPEEPENQYDFINTPATYVEPL